MLLLLSSHWFGCFLLQHEKKTWRRHRANIDVIYPLLCLHFSLYAYSYTQSSYIDATSYFNNLKDNNAVEDIYFFSNAKQYLSNLQLLMLSYSVELMCDPLDPNGIMPLDELSDDSFILSSADLWYDIYYEDVYEL